MSNCEQSSGQSVLDHGISVQAWYNELIKYMTNGHSDKVWKFPEWIHDHRELLLKHALPEDVTSLYQVYHDCGKPRCLTIDEEGRKHFPNHAEVSAQVWREAGGSEEVANLIERDMDVHKLKADGVAEFASRPQAVTLLLTGLAEVHSNASMFGGVDSVSFKIKWKQLDKRGNAICKELACQV